MKILSRSSVPVLIVGGVAWLVVWLARIDPTQTTVFPLLIIFAAVLLGLIASVRHWRRMPLLPLLGIVWASVGYGLDSTLFMNAGFFAFVAMTVWQEQKLERKSVSAATQ